MTTNRIILAAVACGLLSGCGQHAKSHGPMPETWTNGCNIAVEPNARDGHAYQLGWDVDGGTVSIYLRGRSINEVTLIGGESWDVTHTYRPTSTDALKIDVSERLGGRTPIATLYDNMTPVNTWQDVILGSATGTSNDDFVHLDGYDGSGDVARIVVHVGTQVGMFKVRVTPPPLTPQTDPR